MGRTGSCDFERSSASAMDQSEASQDIVPVFVLRCQPLDPASLDASDHVRARITAPTLKPVAPLATVFISHLGHPLVFFDAERLDPRRRNACAQGRVCHAMTGPLDLCRQSFSKPVSSKPISCGLNVILPKLATTLMHEMATSAPPLLKMAASCLA